MSRWDVREDWPRKSRELIALLEARDIDLPDTVTAAVAVLDGVEAAKPTEPSQTALREAFVAGATQAELDALVLADLGAARLASEWRQAQIGAAGRILTAVLASANQILPALRKQAEKAIENLRKVAALNGIRLDHLVRAARHDDARLIADADTTAADLDQLYELRDRYLTRGGPQTLAVNGVNASRWTDPVLASHHASGSGTSAERYVRGLAAGIDLHYPDPAAAIALAQAIADGMAVEAARAKAGQHGVGSVAAFT